MKSDDKEAHPRKFVSGGFLDMRVSLTPGARQTVEGNPKKNIQSLAEQLKLGWVPDREPDLDFDSAWVQERANQLAMLDTFFGALRPISGKAEVLLRYGMTQLPFRR